MGLKEELEEDKKALSEMTEIVEDDEIIETPEPEKVEEEVVEEEPAEDEGEAVEEAPPVKAEEKLDDAGYARLRRENAALKRKNDELEAAKAKPEPIIEEQEAIEQPSLPPELADIIQDKRVQDATKAFKGFEDEARKSLPEYDGIAEAYHLELFKATRLENPRKSLQEIADITHKKMLIKARDYLNAGFENPVEELYHEAVELGIKPLPKEIEEVEAPARLKPDMKKVAENRARNAGTAGAKGRGGVALMTREIAADLPVSEWRKLPLEERQRLMRGE
jgi:hypothetical protein